MSYLQQQISQLIQIANSKQEPYYEVLQSIAFTGNEYFDTGVLGDANTKIEAGIFLTSMPSVESEGNYYIFGSRSGSATANNIDCIWSWQSGLVCDFNNSAYATYRLSVAKTNLALNTVYDITVNKNKRDVSRNGTSLGSNTTVNSDTFTSTNTICIGLVKGANIASYTGFNGGLKYFKINDDDYIPVLDSQMRPCLYNRTTKTFLYAKKISDGTETYDLGFKRWNKYDVDYIQSSGTQYINTGYKPTKYTSFDLYGVDMDYSSGTTRFGSRTGTYSETFVLATIADSHFRWSYGTGSAPATTDNVFNTQKKAKQISWDATTKKCTITFTDDTTETSAQMRGTDLTSSAMPIYLFAFNSVGEAICGTVKHTRIVFREGDVITRDYKPVVWHNGNTTAEACLYDEVYNKMYTNLGTGSFKAYIVGSDNTVYEVGKSITSDGTAYINTGYAFTGDFEWEMIFNGDAVVSASAGKTLYGGRTSTARTALLYKIPSTSKYSMPIAGLNGTSTPLQLDTITGKARVFESVSPTTRKASTRVNDVAKQTNVDIDGTVGIITGTTQIIFADNYGNQVSENANATLFALTMKDCGELVRSYIGVKNSTTNAVGVYDYVNKTFTGNSNNSGTLTFNSLD